MAEKPEQQGPLQQIVQPFIDLIHAPRALWGINLAYVIEGMCYFGMLGYLTIYCSEYIFQAIDGADEAAHYMVMVLTAGITIAMFFLGVVADKRGVRFALIAAFLFMLAGRTVWSGAPNLFGLEPVRPGVFAGDRVSLHVSRLETRNGIKAITKATLIANQEDAVDTDQVFAVDLASGEGIAPGKQLESRLVSLSEAKVVSGEETLWDIEYGSAPVKARLFAHAAEEVGLCVGAVISLDRGYVSAWRDNAADEGQWEYVIRTNWRDDFSMVDRSGCEAGAPEAGGEEGMGEEVLRPKERWTPKSPSAEMQQAPHVSLTELRNMENGPVDVVLRDVYVTYVRNGGYFLQADKQGPAIFVFVDPRWSPLQIATLLGMLMVVIGYGMYQPAAYAGVRKFTTPKTAAMGFAMLYALMNLGGWLPSFAFLLRDDDYLGLGIPGTFWVYAGFTVISLLVTIFILSHRTVVQAEKTAKEETARIKAAEAGEPGEQKVESEGPSEEGTAESPPREEGDTPPRNTDSRERPPNVETEPPPRIKPHLWLFWLAGMALFLFKGESPWYFTWDEASWRWVIAGVIFFFPVFIAIVPQLHRWVAKHPLEDSKFAYFIFALIPVQTLFTYNWLVLPPYINRAFEGWIGDKFEVAANANPLLIFIAVPIITAITQRARVYNMMIYGTFIMAAPAFLLVIGPHWWTLLGYILIMTIGEAMWQPRFLQYAAEIAPEGRTGEYMGVAQLPWFLTKVLVPLLYSGRMMDVYCPAEGPKNTEFMWLIFGCIAICSTILLLLAKGWIGKDFKTKSDS
jgi:MFS family permease